MLEEEVLSDIVETAWACNLTKNQHLVRLLVVGGVCAGAAGAINFFISKARFAKYEAALDRELAETKEFYKRINKQDEFATPQDAVRELIPKTSVSEAADALLQYQGELPDDEVAEETTEVEIGPLVFVPTDEDNDDNFDLEEEMRSRTPDKPYVISKQEFLEGDAGFQQNTLTYYAGDGTLADENDQEIPFAEPIVGEANLERFGHGSDDENVVYVRNERLSLDFEVVRSEGKFAHEVLGMEHSDGSSIGRMRSQRPRFRGGD